MTMPIRRAIAWVKNREPGGFAHLAGVVLEAQLDAARRQITGLKTERDDAVRETGDLRRENEGLHLQLAALRTQMAAAGALQRATDAAAEGQAVIATLEGRLADSATRIAALESDLARAQAEWNTAPAIIVSPPAEPIDAPETDDRADTGPEPFVIDAGAVADVQDGARPPANGAPATGRKSTGKRRTAAGAGRGGKRAGAGDQQPAA